MVGWLADGAQVGAAEWLRSATTAHVYDEGRSSSLGRRVRLGPAGWSQSNTAHIIVIITTSSIILRRR